MTTPAPNDASLNGGGAASAAAQPSSHDLQRHERDERTAALAARLRDCPDPTEDASIRHELIAVNLPLARLLARRYRHRGESQDDLEQVACVGLTEAAHRFDPVLAHSFHSFCVPTILGGLRRHFRDRGWTVRPPRSMQELQHATHRAQAELERQFDRSPTIGELATHLNRDPEDITEALTLHSCYSPLRLDMPVGPERDAPTLGELLPGGNAESGAVEARVMLASAVRSLGERDKRIVHMRFFQGLTQREIAEDIGVTQMQVSRLLARILNDLRRSVGPLEEPPTSHGGPGAPDRPEAIPSRARADKHDPRAVRAWAAAQHIDIPSRGRIPTKVWAEYEAAC